MVLEVCQGGQISIWFPCMVLMKAYGNIWFRYGLGKPYIKTISKPYHLLPVCPATSDSDADLSDGWVST